MSPFAARLDRFVRWFVNAIPSAEIDSSRFLPAGVRHAGGSPLLDNTQGNA